MGRERGQIDAVLERRCEGSEKEGEADQGIWSIDGENGWRREGEGKAQIERSDDPVANVSVNVNVNVNVKCSCMRGMCGSSLTADRLPFSTPDLELLLRQSASCCGLLDPIGGKKSLLQFLGPNLHLMTKHQMLYAVLYW